MATAIVILLGARLFAKSRKASFHSLLFPPCNLFASLRGYLITRSSSFFAKSRKSQLSLETVAAFSIKACQGEPLILLIGVRNPIPVFAWSSSFTLEHMKASFRSMPGSSFSPNVIRNRTKDVAHTKISKV